MFNCAGDAMKRAMLVLLVALVAVACSQPKRIEVRSAGLCDNGVWNPDTDVCSPHPIASPAGMLELRGAIQH